MKKKPSSHTRLHRIAAMILPAALFVLSLIRLLNNPFSVNIFDLLPAKDRTIARHYSILSAFDIIDQAVFEIARTDSGREFDHLARTASTIKDSLEASGFFSFPRQISPEDFFDLERYLLNNRAALFSKEDSAWLIRRLSGDSLSRRFAGTLQGIFTLSDQTTNARALAADPFNFKELLYRKFAALRFSQSMEIENGYITNSGRNRILLTANARDIEYIQKNSNAFITAIKRIKELARRNNCSFTWMSAARAALDNERTIRRDINCTAPIVALFIILLCALIYKRKHYGLLVFLPTALGIVYTLALLSLFGELSIIMLGFGAALTGITIDYAVHYFYHIDTMPGDPSPAKTLLRPISASALTTSSAFGALIIAGIPGLTQLALVTSTGILIVALLALSILPLLFAPSQQTKTKIPAIPLAEKLGRFYESGATNTLRIPIIAVACILWPFTLNLHFDGDPGKLNGMSADTKNAEKLLNTHWGNIQESMFLVVSDSTPDLALLKAEKILDPLLNILEQKHLIEPASAITELVPPSLTQFENRRRWYAVWDSAAIVRAFNVIDSAGKKFGIDAQRFAPFFNDLQLNRGKEFISPDSFPETMTRGLLENFIRKKNGIWFVCTPVISANDTSWNHIDSLATVFDVRAVNDAILGVRLMEIIKNGFVQSALFIPFIIL
ncbi:MAG: hypothetical protein GF350_01900, partial [Chitinivibrionales bacterium]|nr:hypothetical protein [Chitinivibrionales bacterium]